VEEILHQAEQSEKNYDWLGATESYKKALNLLSEDDFSRKGDITERLGYAVYRAAFQAENNNMFRERMRQSVANYQGAKEFYGRLNEQARAPRTFRCDAMIEFAGHWLASQASEKKKLLDECWRLTKESLKAFEEVGDAWEYGKTYNKLSNSAFFGFLLESNFQAREKTVEEAARYGEPAIRFLSTFGDPCELARAYVRTATCLQLFGFYFLNLDQRQKYYQMAMGYWQKANQLSEEAAMIELLNSLGLATMESDWGWGSDEAVKNFKRALEYGNKTKDSFIVGTALSWLAFNISLKLGERILDPDEGVKLLKTALQYAEDSSNQYSMISFVSALWGALWAEAPLAEYYWDLATWETDLGKRTELLEKAKDAASEQLRRALDSGYPEVIMFAHIESSIILFSLAMMETNLEAKKELLEKAMVHRNQAIRINEQFVPFFYWYRGFNQNHLANIKSELADLAKDADSKKNMLQEAILDKETALQLCVKHTTFWEGQGLISSMFPVLGAWQYSYGGLLNHLYELTSNKEYLKKAIDAFKDAAESFHRHNLTSRIAECYWKAAQVHDNLGEHSKAAESFELASNNYKNSAENIPKLKDFYQDHAVYMEAWNEIEKARHHHARQEYGLAKEHYEKAATVHKSLKQWSYLAPNYLAWGQVEKAEDLSRSEKNEEALQAFTEAGKLFTETKKSLETKLGEIQNLDEKTMATNLTKASDTRREYCIGRTALEEAKILDKKGDHYSSSEKYGSAARVFEKVTQSLESEQDRKDLKLILTLSRAWQKMTQAEAEASPTLYLEASQLFEQAKEFSPSEKAKMLTLGHSRFCKALKAGTEFADTRDATLQATAMQHLESAANYYLKAGFQNASEYAKATGLLFDAFLHMDSAKKEVDPEKKAKLYIMAERVLQTSAGSFMKAEHPEKREQVLRLLEKVQEERELAVSLTEILHAPSIISSTKSFATPTPTREEAIGLERFEHAEIQANVMVHPKELKVDENLDLEIELVNAGKGPALLTKITEVVPQGLQLAEEPEIYRVEDSYLNMKGKRLDPLKTEEVRLILKTKTQGVFSLKPTILYLDEDGKYRSHEPEPVSITVKRLEIEGLPPPTLEVSEGTTDRIATGYEDLDKLLYGGIPLSCAVILTSPSCNERDLLVKNFLETGVKNGEVAFYVTMNPGSIKSLAEEFQSSFSVFVCNPQADAMIQDLPNVFKLKGIENLTELGIALTSAIHKLDSSQKAPRRICIDLISDVLLQHHTVQTRRWLTALIPELKSAGFTTLAVIDPQIHPPEELHAILGLFDGEINVYERGPKKYLKVQKMSNQEYLESELLLKKEDLQKRK
jgi:KaiC/GvpD/RAD55 family RecA-like ATPase